MTAQVLLILLACVTVGALLIALGLRGKRLNDHPTCRDCGFDLAGAPAGTVTCPECGAGLKRAKGVRIGQRRKRPVWIGAGAVLAGLPLLIIGTVAWALLTGTQIDQYKPLGLLLLEAKLTSALRMQAIAKELNRRIINKTLSAAQRSGVVRTALDIQEDVHKPWFQEWGDLIEDARTDNMLSKEDAERFRRNAVTWEWKIRSRVRAGDPLPIVALVKESRVGSTTSMMGFATLGEAFVDDLPVQRDHSGEAMPMGDDPSGMFQIAGLRSPWGSAFGATAPQQRLNLPVQLPVGLAPGAHKCELVLRTKAIVQPGGSYTWPRIREDKAGDVKDTTATLRFESSPASEEAIAMVQASAETTEKLQRMLRPRPIMVWDPPPGVSNFGSRYLSNIEFPVDGLSVDVAYDVFLRAEDRTIPVGQFTSGISADMSQTYFGPGYEKIRVAQGDLLGIGKAKTVTVILKPSIAAAVRTIDVTRIYGGELVFEDVTVTHQQQQVYAAPPPPPADSTDPATKGWNAGAAATLRKMFAK